MRLMPTIVETLGSRREQLQAELTEATAAYQARVAATIEAGKKRKPGKGAGAIAPPSVKVFETMRERVVASDEVQARFQRWLKVHFLWVRALKAEAAGG